MRVEKCQLIAGEDLIDECSGQPAVDDSVNNILCQDHLYTRDIVVSLVERSDGISNTFLMFLVLEPVFEIIWEINIYVLYPNRINDFINHWK